jgi:hypothetical protein
MEHYEQLLQFAIGCCGAFTSEILHWHRISRRGKWPKYAASPVYWVVTLLLVLCGGLVAASVSPPSASPLQLLLVGIAGPQLLQLAAQSRKPLGSKDDELYLGSNHRMTIFDFLGQ